MTILEQKAGLYQERSTRMILKNIRHHHIIQKVCCVLLSLCLLTCGFSHNVYAGYSRNYPLPKLTGNYQKDIISVAESQFGYHESKTGETIFSAWAKQPRLPWCSEFVAWCANKAGIPKSIVPVGTCTRDYRKFFSAQGRYYILNNGQDHRACGCRKAASKTISFSSIRPGDILLVSSEKNFAKGSTHTCMVISVNRNTVVTIDGNVKDQVTYCIRTASQIHGICRPLYNLTKVASKIKALSGKRVQLTWKKLRGVSGFQIYRSTHKTSGYHLVKTVKGTDSTYIDGKLNKNGYYYYKIRPYQICNGKRVYGSFSNPMAVKVK